MLKIKQDFNIVFILILVLRLANSQHIQDIRQSQKTFTQLFVENKCNLTRTQNKFAIVTVSHLRNPQGEFQYGVNFFKDYLKQYAEMDCDAFDSIYIIWNNEISPEEHNILQRKEFFKKQVYFLHTQSNNMDYRYIIPSWVEQQIFVSLDDDAVIDCQNLKKMFTQWKKASIGNLGPLGTPHERIIHYSYQLDYLKYQYSSKKMMSIALPNIAIIPRHYMDLYYSKIPQFQRMRQIVRQYANCDDIALNFMVSQVYPEFNVMKFQNINNQLKSSKVQTYQNSGHYQKRVNCSNLFTQIFGHFSLQYGMNSDQYMHKNERIQVKSNNLCLTELKRNIIQIKYFTHKQYFLYIKRIYAYNSIKNSFVKKDNLILTKKFDEKLKMIEAGQININFIPKNTFNNVLRSRQLNIQVNSFQNYCSQSIENQSENKATSNDSYSYMIYKFIISCVVLVMFFIIYYQWKKINNLVRLLNAKKTSQKYQNVQNVQSFSQQMQ